MGRCRGDASVDVGKAPTVPEDIALAAIDFLVRDSAKRVCAGSAVVSASLSIVGWIGELLVVVKADVEARAAAVVAYDADSRTLALCAT